LRAALRSYGQALLDVGITQAADRRRHDRAGGQRLAVHQLVLDRVDVDRLVQRAAHPHVLERVLALDVAVEQLVARLVHADEDDAVLDAVDHLHARRVAQPLEVGGRRVEDEVDLARDERATRVGALAIGV
jgi:hypothetical protein